jgi:hypothetical protein
LGHVSEELTPWFARPGDFPFRKSLAHGITVYKNRVGLDETMRGILLRQRKSKVKATC